MTFLTNAFTTITSVIIVFTSLSTPTTSKSLEYGIYSIDPTHYQLNNFTIHHYFSTWHPNENARNIDILTKINSTINNPRLSPKSGLITLEPWPIFNENKDQSLLLTNIANGLYSKPIADFCGLIEKSAKSTITVRWGHEMDLFQSSSYPWTTPDTALFIKAYKKWVDTCNQSTSKVKYMWSPSGHKGNDKYYPGDNYVDYVGMSWYSYPAFEWYTYGKKILTFKQHMDWKYNYLKGFNKPIIAAEFGAAETNKTDVLKMIKNKSLIERDYPLLHSIILFSDYTPSWIPNKISNPDWRLDKEYLSTL